MSFESVHGRHAFDKMAAEESERDDRRREHRKRSHTTAWAIRVGDQWFAGFGGRPPGPYIVKLRYVMADALLCVSPERAQDYVTRLAGRGYAGAVIVTIQVAE